MAITQKKSRRKNTGSRYKDVFSKKKANNGSVPTLSRIGPLKVKTERVLGGHKKERILFSEEANVSDPKTNKIKKEVIVNVSENSANRNYIRRNILTKGAIVDLKSGKKAKITSRPGQEKIINAVLLE